MRRFLPAAVGVLALGACSPTQWNAVGRGPPPAPCVDSVAARVARMPPESVSVADREHAATAQRECELRLAAGAGNPALTSLPATCLDSVAARVARMPPESVSVADREHAAAAHQVCQLLLAAQPQNPASRWPVGVYVLLGVLVAVVMFAL